MFHKAIVLRALPVDLTRTTPYGVMARKVLKLLVKKGGESLGRCDEPQFRICVVPDAQSPNTRWALVVSLSHIIADGHTFYQVHNMLSEDSPVVALSRRARANIKVDCITKHTTHRTHSHCPPGSSVMEAPSLVSAMMLLPSILGFQSHRLAHASSLS